MIIILCCFSSSISKSSISYVWTLHFVVRSFNNWIAFMYVFQETPFDYS